MTYGERLRELRAERRLSLRQVEERGGPNKDTMSLIERDVHRPHAQTLGRIAQALDMSVTALRTELEAAERPLAQAPPSQEKLFNNGVSEEERRIKAEVFVYCLRYSISRAEYYEQELERGHTNQYATASGALTLASLAFAEFDGFLKWIFSGPAWELQVAALQNPDLDYLGDFKAAMDTMIDRQTKALQALFDNAERLAETEQQKDALAAKRQQAAELSARMEPRSA